MGKHPKPHRIRSLAPVALLLLAAACGDAAPPEPGEGAAGIVSQADPDSGESPSVEALPGGPAGQTPAYDQAGSAPKVVQSQPDAAGVSAGSGDPPLR